MALQLRIARVLATALLIVGCAGPGSPASPGATGPGDSAGAPSPGASGIPGGSPVGGASPAATPGAAATIPTRGTWARLEVGGGPPAREDHTWTVDETGGSAYLFGGRGSGESYDDLWRFDLAADAWHRVEVAGGAARPAARFGHEAAWVPGRGLVVWAGQAGATFFDDLWLFDPGSATWRQLPGGGLAPIARYGSCSGLGPDGRLWISHGFTTDGARFADTAAYDFEAGTWSDQAPAGAGPVERCLHACWWTSDGRFVLYGGQTTGVPALGDLWLLTPGTGGAPTNAWSEVSSPAPAARQLAAVGRRRSTTFVVGGRGTDRKALADAWLLGDGEASFTPLEATGTGPSARSGASLAYDAAGDRFLLFGGVDSEPFDDLWELRFD